MGVVEHVIDVELINIESGPLVIGCLCNFEKEVHHGRKTGTEKENQNDQESKN